METREYEINGNTYTLTNNFVGVWTTTAPDGRKVAFEFEDENDLLETMTIIDSGGSVARIKLRNMYPSVVQKVTDVMAVVDVLSIELDNLRARGIELTNEGFLYYMSEERIIQWENALSLSHASTDTLDDRRKAIVAKLRGQSKFNVETIQKIVKTFTGGECTVSIDNGTITVNILPPDDGTTFNFTTVRNELQSRIPAHLYLNLTREYSTWDDVKSRHADWQAVNDSYENWQELNDYIEQEGG